MTHPAGSALVAEKLDQAVEILREQDVDLWLTLVRETLLTSDPCLDLIAGTYCAWQGAFLISRTGERIAIVGRFDAASVEQLGAYSEVVGYDESLRPPLRSCDRAACAALDCAQLLGERPRRRRPHTRTLAPAFRDAGREPVRRPPRFVREDRERPPWPEVGGRGRTDPGSGRGYRGDPRGRYSKACAGYV